MDDIVFYCACGQKVRAPGHFAGKRIKCPECGGKLTIPGAAPGMPGQPGSPVAALEALPPLEAMAVEPLTAEPIPEDEAVVPMAIMDDEPPVAEPAAAPGDDAVPFPFAAAPARPRRKSGGGGVGKKILILLLVLAILGGGGFAVWKFILDKPDASVATEVEAIEIKGGSIGRILNITEFLGPKGARIGAVLPGRYVVKGTYDRREGKADSGYIRFSFEGKASIAPNETKTRFDIPKGELQGAFELTMTVTRWQGGPGTPSVVYVIGSDIQEELIFK
jgi:hypothetical protein